MVLLVSPAAWARSAHVDDESNLANDSYGSAGAVKTK